MSKEQKAKPGPGATEPAPQGKPKGDSKPDVGAKVIPISSGLCVTEECKAKATRAGFCDEHFTWFKEGLITKEGKRVPDFDKKFQSFSKRKAARKTA